VAFLSVGPVFGRLGADWLSLPLGCGFLG